MKETLKTWVLLSLLLMCVDLKLTNHKKRRGKGRSANSDLFAKYFKKVQKKSSISPHHKKSQIIHKHRKPHRPQRKLKIPAKDNRSLGMFPQIPGTPGTESPTFPPLIPNDETPIIINSPPVELPKKQKPTDLQGHIIFVPTIIYPKKKKRIIVHHENSMMGYYNRYIHGMNGYYLNWFKQNPGYQDWMKDNAYWKAVQGDKKMQEYLKKVHPGGKDAKASKSGSSMMGGFGLI